jgi:hypothetical protein
MLTEDQAFWFTVGLFALAALIWVRQSWIYFTQMSLFSLVLCGNIYWKLTPNPYLAVMLAMFVSVALTAFIFASFRSLSSYRSRKRHRLLAARATSQQRPHHCIPDRLLLSRHVGSNDGLGDRRS